MRKTTIILLMFVGFGVATVHAQQDAMFTKYMFNSLVFNPAYAGSNGHMSVAVLHRTQWAEIPGAPTTQTITAHTPLENDRVGVGFSLINDAIGPTNNLGANVSYAYKIPVGVGNLAIGLQAGVENYRADWSKIITENPDIAFGESPNLWLPNFGAGFYYSTNKFYAGFGVPHLVEYDLRKDVTTDIYARQARHYYFSLGGAIPVKGDDIIFKPSALVKNVGLFAAQSKHDQFKDIGAPTEVDIDISFLFQETFWIGASFRSAIEWLEKDENGERKSSFDSADIWMSYFLSNGIRIGAAYDYPLSELATVTSGSFEVMLGYEFYYRTKKIVTPRYF